MSDDRLYIKIDARLSTFVLALLHREARRLRRDIEAGAGKATCERVKLVHTVKDSITNQLGEIRSAIGETRFREIVGKGLAKRLWREEGK